MLSMHSRGCMSQQFGCSCALHLPCKQKLVEKVHSLQVEEARRREEEAGRRGAEPNFGADQLKVVQSAPVMHLNPNPMQRVWGGTRTRSARGGALVFRPVLVMWPIPLPFAGATSSSRGDTQTQTRTAGKAGTSTLSVTGSPETVARRTVEAHSRQGNLSGPPSWQS